MADLKQYKRRHSMKLILHTFIFIPLRDKFSMYGMIGSKISLSIVVTWLKVISKLKESNAEIEKKVPMNIKNWNVDTSLYVNVIIEMADNDLE